MLMMTPAKPAGPVPPDRLLLSVQDVARLCGIGERTVWTLTAKRDFPQPVKINGSTRWHRSDVEKWISDLKAG